MKTGTVAGLRPNTTIQCLYCDQQKPQAWSVKFRAHHVCSECAKKLRALPEKEKK